MLKRVDYIEFEHHGVGDWKTQKLEDAIDLLSSYGMICYWTGQNQLWKIIKVRGKNSETRGEVIVNDQKKS